MRWRCSRRQFGRLAGLGMMGTVLTGDRRATATAQAVVGLAPLPPEAVGTESAETALGRALVAATGKPTPLAAVRSIFEPGDIVGVKVNALAGRAMSPHPALVAALASLLRAAGVPPASILVFDRSSRELQRAGYALSRSGDDYRCLGIDNDYDSHPSASGSIGSCFATLVSTTCTALVSFGVVKDHDLSGVSVGVKNWYGVIHNPNKYHDNNCDPYLADLIRHPFLRDKIRLTVIDGTTAQYHGGPAFRADTTFALGIVAASVDPLACDVWGWQVIDVERRRRGLPSLEQSGRPPRYLATAAGYGLGVADPASILEVTR